MLVMLFPFDVGDIELAPCTAAVDCNVARSGWCCAHRSLGGGSLVRYAGRGA